jgi:hypothetical protein
MQNTSRKMILNLEVTLLVPELKGYQTPKVQSSDVQQQQQQLSLLSQASWGFCPKQVGVG